MKKEQTPTDKLEAVAGADEQMTINSDGDEIWRKDGVFHRSNDLPAKVFPSGSKEWWFNGKRHRSAKDENGLTLPAIERSNGVKEWWFEGKRHRVDKDKDGHCLPAITAPLNEDQIIYLKNADSEKFKLIVNVLKNKGICAPNEDIIFNMQWWVNGVLHREDKAYGVLEKDIIVHEIISAGSTLPALIMYEKFNNYFHVLWYNNGSKHRTDKIDHNIANFNDYPILKKCQTFPAELSCNSLHWWQFSARHQSDVDEHGLSLPAVVAPFKQEWWINGTRHREGDLPAIERQANLKSKSKMERVNLKQWYKNDRQHRDNGLPSCEMQTLNEKGVVIEDYQDWHFEGKLHRMDGPSAMMNAEPFKDIDGKELWFVNGVSYKKNDHPFNVAKKEKKSILKHLKSEGQSKDKASESTDHKSSDAKQVSPQSFSTKRRIKL